MDRDQRQHNHAPNKQRWLTICLVLLIALQPGCAYIGNWRQNGFKVGPNYCTPPAPVAPAWIDTYDQRVLTDCPQMPEWWMVFNDPTMSQLVYSAYQQYLPLRVAGLRVLEARALQGIAKGNFFPQRQNSFGSYSRTQISFEAFPFNTLAAAGVPLSRAFSDWQKGFDAAWELDVWGKFRRNIESADANVAASDENYNDILITLFADTASAYVQYRTTQQRLAYALANIKIQEGSLEIADTKFRMGGTTELDVAQAKTNLQNTRELVPLLRNQLRLTNNRLCVLLGIPTRDLAGELGIGAIPSAPPTVAVGVPANLLRRRPDVRRAEREAAAQSAQIGVAAADWFPSISLVGSVAYAAEDFDNLFQETAFTGFINPQFNWPIFNYGRIANNVLLQDARFQQLAVLYQQTVLAANAEAENAINTFLEAQQRRIEIKAAVEAAERAVELGTIQYRDGATDFNRVFNLQTVLVQEQDRLASIEGDVANSLIAIYKALGGGWEIRNGYAAPAPCMPQSIAASPPLAQAMPQPAASASEGDAFEFPFF